MSFRKGGREESEREKSTVSFLYTYSTFYQKLLKMG
jgi:hypothetical protein